MNWRTHCAVANEHSQLTRFHSTTCNSTARQNCFKKEHLAQCEHPDCLPTKDWPGRAFQTKFGCTIHSYRKGWNLNHQPGYTGPKNYVRPAMKQSPPAAAAEHPTSDRTKKRTKRLKRWVDTVATVLECRTPRNPFFYRWPRRFILNAEFWTSLDMYTGT